MVVNVDKLVICFNGMHNRMEEELLHIFHFLDYDFSEGFEYLGFMLKPNSYK